MALHDLTRDAVLDALDEYEDLGVEQFLVKYSFAAQAAVLLDYVGRSYDGRAVVAAAHGFQYGTPLTPTDLADCDADTAEVLARLKFHVRVTEKARPKKSTRSARSATPRRTASSGTARPAARSAAAPAPSPGKRAPVPDWAIEPGEFVVRRDIARVHGDPMTKHIEATVRTPNVLVFADPYRDGSHDGWSADRSAYFVTGEGKRGDQSWSAGNDALRTHATAGRVVRLFEPEETWRPGGQRHCYLGGFRLDDTEPYRRDISPDSQGQDRQVYVFKLVPTESGVGADGQGPGDVEQGEQSIETGAARTIVIDDAAG